MTDDKRAFDAMMAEIEDSDSDSDRKSSAKTQPQAKRTSAEKESAQPKQAVAPLGFGVVVSRLEYIW